LAFNMATLPTNSVGLQLLINHFTTKEDAAETFSFVLFYGED